MRLDDERESQNIEDRRGGMSGFPRVGAGGLGIGSIIIALVAMYFGVDPSVLTGLTSPQAPAPVITTGAKEDPAKTFVAKVLGSTEDVWHRVFEQSGSTYSEPKLVLFTGLTATSCGTGQAAMGPFYCPLDQTVYIDLNFYHELQDRFKAPGDFAQAYVIAHEVGHHVQNLLGVSDKVRQAQQRARSQAQANALSVRLELQADCYAGVWANQANEAHQILQQGDVEEALNAASAIGDDTLQKQMQSQVVPDSFTHGSAEQRVRWFSRGLESGDPQQCDTFKRKRST